MGYIDHIIKDNIRTDLFSQLLAKDIAKIFDPQDRYEIDDYCIYNTKLYRFIKFHSGDWADADAIEISVSDEMKTFSTQTATMNGTLSSNSQDISNLKTQVDTLTSNDEGMDQDIDDLKDEMNTLSNGLKGKADTFRVGEDQRIYIYSGDELLTAIGPFSGGTGGGGGSGEPTNTAEMTFTNTTGWITSTISASGTCNISFEWSSIQENTPTGDGSLTVYVNSVSRITRGIAQGSVSFDVSSYLIPGRNLIRLAVYDTYENVKYQNYTISVVDLQIRSSFDSSVPFTGEFLFPYTPVGAVEKTVHFLVDGEEIGTEITSVTGRQLSYTIPAQSYGSHSLTVYCDADVAGEIIKSNTLYYEFIFIDGSSTRTTITTSFAETSIKQYTTVNIPYRVYSPLSANVEVKLYVNGSLISTQTVNRDEQSYSYRAEETGNIIFRIEANNTIKDIEFEVTSGDIDIKPEANDLALYLTAQGRSNNESTRDVWEYKDIQATFSNFTWRLDGWQLDDDNISVMRVQDDARIIIPYKIFEQDFKGTGKTIEIEFATHSVVDYSAVIVNCMSGNIGFQITPQSVIFKGAQTSIQALYKDNEHVRVSIVVEKQIDNRLICVYINGIMSGAIQYASGERFSQLTPMNILIGSDDCGIDIYNIRVYDNNLNRMQIVDNWIADTQIGELMIQRYNHNDIYNPNMEITTETLPNNLPYFILDAEELPQYKGDKKTISLTYVDPITSSKSFTATGVEINVQGTSSSIYYFKNFDLKFKQGFQTNSGTVDGYMLRNNSIPFNRFVLKADVASSESANNTVLSMFYSDSDPYKVPEQIEDPRVRQGIEGIPVAVFWHNTKTEEIKFHGKYNFNLPKRAAAPYGYDGEEESWEFERNNSANMKFQDDDFETQAWDEVNQKFYPEWYDDWQARFPSDEWRDISKLKEFVSWVKSTYRDAATNENLPEQVTYTLNSTITVDSYPDDESYTVTDGAGGSKVIIFTKDTPAYRLTKFKAEAGKYMELDSAYYYYLYTLMFLMIDSRAKNMFIGFHGGEATELINEGSAIDRKVVFEPYDMDTAIGTNNSGVLMFPYHLLDIDTASAVISGSGSEAPVYNAQDSVLWCNIRDAFRAEYTAMYRSLRANRVWTYQGIEDLFENHQAKWPEAMYNEDAYEKYLVPLIDPVTKDETTGQLIRTDRYLTMLQGSKEQQRKWWLSNRFRYLDSMFSSGDAVNNTINLRLFNAGTLQITPAIDLFVGVSFGGGTTPAIARTTANHPASFSYSPKSGVTEMETWIYSADLITDVGDLSGFYPNEIDFSKATKLQNLKIGSGEQGYSNTNLRALNVQNCLLLENIDVRNCPNLAINVNLENSTRLKSALFEGSSITGVDLADGGVLETLHLPATVAQLTLLNLSKLSDLQIASYSNITRLMIANMNHLINPQTILGLVPANTEINIVGIDLTYNTYEEIKAFYDLLDTMKGITRQKNSAGEWMYHNFDKAQVSGVIRIEALTGSQVAELEARYPELDVIANHTTSYRYYKSYDGTVDVGTVRCTDGVPESAAPAVPARAQTAQYSYTPLGWDSDMNSYNSDYDHNAITKGDMTYYAAYTRTVRTYTVTWNNSNGTTLETDNNVAYGSTPTYNGSTPVDPSGNSSPFVSWTPAISSVTGNVTYTASYKPVWTVTFKNQTGATTLQTKTVVDGNTATYTGNIPTNTDGTTFLGWAASANASTADANILKNIKANKTVYAAHESLVEDVEITDTWDQIIQHIDKGDYKTRYKIGNYKPLDLGTTYGTINMQIVAIDGDDLASGGKAPLSFVAKELLLQTHRMNATNTNAGGWPVTEIRSWLLSTIKPLITASVTERIQNVNKTYYDYDSQSTKTQIDTLWIPSAREMFGGTSYEDSGMLYTTIFKDDTSRIKNLNGSTTRYWLRSAGSSSASHFRHVSSGGIVYYNYASLAGGVCVGFCLGFETETITDSWDTIFSNTNPSATYSVGDTKSITINGEQHLMQIVAFNADEMTVGGNAKISWLMKDQLSTTHNMNATATNENGWPVTAMRTWLRDTILPTIDFGIRSHIVDVNKTYYDYTDKTTEISSDNIWLASAREIFGGTSYESSGVDYTSLFKDSTSRIKKRAGSAAYWWLRSAHSSNAIGFRSVNSSGNVGDGNASVASGVCVGFCTN